MATLMAMMTTYLSKNGEIGGARSGAQEEAIALIGGECVRVYVCMYVCMYVCDQSPHTGGEMACPQSHETLQGCMQ